MNDILCPVHHGFSKCKRFGIFFFANREFKTGVSCMNCKGSKTGCSFYRIRNGKPTFLQSKKKIQEVMDMGERKCAGDKHSLNRFLRSLLCLITQVFTINFRFLAAGDREDCYVPSVSIPGDQWMETLLAS